MIGVNEKPVNCDGSLADWKNRSEDSVFAPDTLAFTCRCGRAFPSATRKEKAMGTPDTPSTPGVSETKEEVKTKREDKPPEQTRQTEQDDDRWADDGGNNLD